MARYLVPVELRGVIVIDADTPAEAVLAAGTEKFDLATRRHDRAGDLVIARVFDRVVAVGPVENVVPQRTQVIRPLDCEARLEVSVGVGKGGK